MKYIPRFLIFILFISCRINDKTLNNETIDYSLIDNHNSMIALDWAGTYKGVLPCADCYGIKWTLTLTDDYSYTLEEVYLNYKKETVLSEGKFYWNEAGSEITLDDEKRAIKFKVGENFLLKLDVEGKEIKSDLADNYILKKEL